MRTFEVLVEQARSNATLQEEGLRIADSRFRHGVTSELDVDPEAATLLETTRASIPKLQSGLLQSAKCIEHAARTADRRAFRGAGSSNPRGIPIGYGGDVATSLPAELRGGPDVRSAELLAIAQCARIESPRQTCIRASYCSARFAASTEQYEARIQVCLGDSNPRALGYRQQLGAAHIRPPPQQFRRQARGHVRRSRWNALGLLNQRRNRAGRLSEQRAQYISPTAAGHFAAWGSKPGWSPAAWQPGLRPALRSRHGGSASRRSAIPLPGAWHCYGPARPALRMCA